MMNRERILQIRIIVIDNMVWLILAIVVGLFSVMIDGFFQWGIFMNILRQSAIVGILSLALALVIIAGYMDLSIESTMALSAMVAAFLVARNGNGLHLPIPFFLTLFISCGIGGAVGAFNGFLVARLHINAFIATLAPYIMVRGIGLVLTGGGSMYGLPSGYAAIASSDFLGIPLLIIILVSVFCLFHALLRYMRYGRYLYLLGGNITACFRAGLPVERLIMSVFIVSGILSAGAGWLLAARTNSATPNSGVGMLFDALAAVIIGGVSLNGGIGTLSGVFAGVLLLGSIDTAINIMGIDAYYMQLIKGAMVLIAVLLDRFKVYILQTG